VANQKYKFYDVCPQQYLWGDCKKEFPKIYSFGCKNSNIKQVKSIFVSSSSPKTLFCCIFEEKIVFTFYQLAHEPTITISLFDVVAVPVLFIITYFILKLIFKNTSPDHPNNKFLIPALFLKMFFSLLFCMIYIFFYEGDAHAYYRNIHVLMNLFYENPTAYLKILIFGPREEYFYFFSHRTGYPFYYMWSDPNTFSVSRIISAVSLLTHKSFIMTSLITSIITFSGIWKLYQVFWTRYPHLKKELAIAVLFIPSVLFWSSGIMKESLLIMSVGWFIWAFDGLFSKKFSFIKLLILLFSANLLLLVKPYVFITIVATVFIWASYERSTKFQNKIVRKLTLPFMLLAAAAGYIGFYANMGSELGKYGSIEGMITKAKVTQEDLVRAEQYGENSFYIGNISSSPFELIKLAPQAIVAGLFRPFIWEAKNPFMLFSAIENLFFLILTIFVFFRVSFWKVFYFIGKDPFLLSIFFFSISFSYGVGLSTSNFGALVRYKIPLIPFLLATLFIARDYHKQYMKQFETKDKSFLLFRNKEM